MGISVFAWTAPTGEGYPEFVSVNEAPGSTEGEPKLEVIVRSPRKPDGSCGDVATIVLGKEQIADLGLALLGTTPVEHVVKVVSDRVRRRGVAVLLDYSSGVRRE